MRLGRHGFSEGFSGSRAPPGTLDPTTRLLASVADAVSRTRAEIPGSFKGKVVLYCAIFSILGFIVCTSIFWMPLLIAAAWMYILIWLAKHVVRYVQAQYAKGRSKVNDFLNLLLVPPDSPRDRERIRRTLSDQSFVRSMMDALPGVDTTTAMRRISSLTKFCVVTSPRGNGPRVNEGGVRGCCKDAGTEPACGGNLGSYSGFPAGRRTLSGDWISEDDLDDSSDGEGLEGDLHNANDPLMDLVKQGFLAMKRASKRDSRRDLSHEYAE